MKLSYGFKALCGLALASVSFAMPADSSDSDVIAALYSQANDDVGNNIIVFDIHSDGTVSFKTAYPTGGNGGTQYYNPMQADALRSEGSVFVHENWLYQVNAGSDTIGVWQIDPMEPSKLSQIGGPINSGGEFPVSINVNSKTGTVCVANAGTLNGVQCFDQTQEGLVKMDNTNRLLLFPQSSPPTFNNSIMSMSTVLFSRDGSKLLVDVKGLTDENVPGFIAMWDVNDDGSLSPDHQLFPAPGKGALNFGMSYLPEEYNGYVMGDPSSGGIIYDFTGGFEEGQWRSSEIKIPGQEFTCWATYSNLSDTYWFSDFGVQAVYEVKINLTTFESQLINKFQLDPVKTVNIDHRLAYIGDRQFLYQLAPYGSLVTVFDIQPNGQTKEIQSYNFSEPLRDAGVPFTIYSPAGLYYHVKETN